MARYSSFAFLRGHYTVAADYSKAMRTSPSNQSALLMATRNTG
jgi:hypothetical protein